MKLTVERGISVFYQMDTLFAQLKKIYDHELYDQVQPVVSDYDSNDELFV